MGSGVLCFSLSLMEAGLITFLLVIRSYIQGDAHYLLFSFWQECCVLIFHFALHGWVWVGRGWYLVPCTLPGCWMTHRDPLWSFGHLSSPWLVLNWQLIILWKRTPSYVSLGSIWFRLFYFPWMFKPQFSFGNYRHSLLWIVHHSLPPKLCTAFRGLEIWLNSSST